MRCGYYLLSKNAQWQLSVYSQIFVEGKKKTNGFLLLLIIRACKSGVCPLPTSAYHVLISHSFQLGL